MGQRLNMKDGLRDQRSITLTEFVGGKFQIYKQSEYQVDHNAKKTIKFTCPKYLRTIISQPCLQALYSQLPGNENSLHIFQQMNG